MESGFGTGLDPPAQSMDTPFTVAAHSFTTVAWQVEYVETGQNNYAPSLTLLEPFSPIILRFSDQRNHPCFNLTTTVPFCSDKEPLVSWVSEPLFTTRLCETPVLAPPDKATLTSVVPVAAIPSPD